MIDETLTTTPETLEPKDATFATIGEIYDDGVTLIFDGQETATEKHYKVNRAILFAAGDRVKIVKDCGTYVVEYPVGVPNSGGGTSGSLADALTNAWSGGNHQTIKLGNADGETIYYSFDDMTTFKVLVDKYNHMPRGAKCVQNHGLANYPDYDIHFKADQYGNNLQFSVNGSSWKTLANG